MEYLFKLSAWVRQYLNQVSLGIIATLLVVYGNDLNTFFRRRMRRFPFIVRVTLFVLLCSAGYGAAAYFSAGILTQLLTQLSDTWLAPIIVLLFVGIGYLAEEKRHI